MSKISYSAVVLDDRSKERLLKRVEHMIPKDWEIIADHMTINMGEIKPELENQLGLPIRLMANSFAINDMVAAVGVSGYYSEKEQPHITVAVNRKEGGKPKMSNELKRWDNIKRPIPLVGVVKEVPLNIGESEDE